MLPTRRIALLLALSGAAALTYEVLWMRRFALLFGGGAIAVTLTVATLFGGLGLGGLLGARLPARRPTRTYAVLEALGAVWALALPLGLAALTPWYRSDPGLLRQVAVVVALALPPAVALGATLPVLARDLPGHVLPKLYAANTLGATVGVLAVPAVLLPVFGVTGAERLAAGVGLLVAVGAWTLRPMAEQAGAAETQVPAGWRAVLAVAVTGLCGMALEVAWTRLGGVLLGPSVHALAGVLAVYLGAVAFGARWARSLSQDWLGPAVSAMGVLAVGGTFVYGEAPWLLAQGFDVLGARGMFVAEWSLAALTMAGAPVASGVVFGLALRRGQGARSTGILLGANTLAGVVGSASAGLVLLPLLGIQGVVGVCAAALAAVGVVLSPKRGAVGAAVLAVLLLVQPAWDGKLYAVGVYNRVSDLGDRSRAGVNDFADEGWTLLSYEEGRTGAVALGQSTQTGNIWLSINGKVDASTGDDMPTQVLSGQLPVRMAATPQRVLVVGLASGVTAGAVLAEPGVQELVVVELEPRVVDASHAFDHVNGRPLDDPRTRLRVEDARAVLAEPGAPFDVIISEPSNPWITGVSNLFTLEYWTLGRSRLSPNGVFCQWIQLYGLAPSELRSVVTTFTQVFPVSWLFESLEGGDLLLLGTTGSPRMDQLPVAPVLTPSQVIALGGDAPLNTDDRPRVELQAPRSMHLATVGPNRAAIESAKMQP
jgi:spermidine synthase